MRVGINPENLLEKSALALGQVPQPAIETQACLILARSLIAATQLGVFEALGSSSLSAEEIAGRCNLNKHALTQLLDALVATDYLAKEGESYSLAVVARKWLLSQNESSLYDFTISRVLAWEWLTHLEEFIRTGEPLESQDKMTPDHWQLYHRGLRSIASLAAPEVVQYTPVPTRAQNMLDVGGSHGYFSVTLCRRYPDLQAVILDLPEQIEYAGPLLAEEGMGDRVVYKAGNVLTDDLGTNVYDLVFMANLVQQFDEHTNIELFQRLAQALRPGGHLVVQKTILPSKQDGQLGALGNLFLSLTSAGSNWSFSEIAQWQQKAGLVPRKPIQFRRTPATGQQVAVKP
ncbi:MAG: methyltransferase domain-containing protein [Moorea sp. SIO3I7]|uniref:class I SAM-dependent methyltransferase n=1 Tax=Moorena sp. SIO3I8 TaxID=2607833 RepID=UPI0013BEC57C|nr:class I SAM-dependent methyltransferase [Moorena sp. SIO3I8]NEN97016.1 methyltransferase domain-containing protein [Moorena sp. SIO3I7]NEO04321.1 methyltransferase domain-containing protein [Moorena sp. SIO3I8]